MAESSASFTMGGERYVVHGEAKACQMLSVKLMRLRMYEQRYGEKFCLKCGQPYKDEKSDGG